MRALAFSTSQHWPNLAIFEGTKGRLKPAGITAANHKSQQGSDGCAYPGITLPATPTKSAAGGKAAVEKLLPASAETKAPDRLKRLNSWLSGRSGRV